MLSGRISTVLGLKIGGGWPHLTSTQHLKTTHMKTTLLCGAITDKWNSKSEAIKSQDELTSQILAEMFMQSKTTWVLKHYDLSTSCKETICLSPNSDIKAGHGMQSKLRQDSISSLWAMLWKCYNLALQMYQDIPATWLAPSKDLDLWLTCDFSIPQIFQLCATLDQSNRGCLYCLNIMQSNEHAFMMVSIMTRVAIISSYYH